MKIFSHTSKIWTFLKPYIYIRNLDIKSFMVSTTDFNHITMITTKNSNES